MTKGQLKAFLESDGGDDDQDVQIYVGGIVCLGYFDVGGVTDIGPMPPAEDKQGTGIAGTGTILTLGEFRCDG